MFFLFYDLKTNILNYVHVCEYVHVGASAPKGKRHQISSLGAGVIDFHVLPDLCTAN